MFKKANMPGIICTAVVAAVVFAIVGGDVLAEVWSGIQAYARQEIRNTTSVEFDLARLDQLVQEVSPNLSENRRIAAEVDVELELLLSDTVVLKTKQETRLEEMKELRKAIASSEDSSQSIEVDGKQYSSIQVERELSRRLRSFEQTEKQLKVREELIAKRRGMLQDAILAIEDAEQEQLELVDISDSLDAELRLLGAATTVRKLDFENAPLTKAKALAKDLRKRMMSMERTSIEQSSSQRIPVNLERRSIAQRLDAKFGW